MKRFMYLFFSRWKFMRIMLGGRWVKMKVDGASWVHFEESILNDRIAFECLQENPKEYITEVWL